MKRFSYLVLPLLFLFLSSGAIGQDTRLEFEVASIRPNNSGSGSAASGIIQGNRFTSTNVTLIQMLRTAYAVQEFQIVGQPGWANSDRFDIEARMPPGAKEWQPMFQALVADRFKLKVHLESKEVAVFALVVGRNGHKLKPADLGKCKEANTCGFRASPTEILGGNVSMSDLATRLSRSLGRTVIDKTDLKGQFDLTLKWTAEENIPLGPGASASPAIFAAIQDQLGLRLESTKAPVETLVIDQVERPSEN